MVFKRRTPKTTYQWFKEALYPRGGWTRAFWYVTYRMRRLPDPAHKISRGIAAGVFTSFTPLFGFHFVLAAALAGMMRGNILAAILATFFGNPLTFPLIVAVSMEVGSWLLGRPSLPLPMVFEAFTAATLDLWHNMIAIFTPATTHWHGLFRFFDGVFLPYLVGGILPGIASGLAAYFLSNPLIIAYQKRRVARLKKRFAKKREKAISRIERQKSEGFTVAE